MFCSNCGKELPDGAVCCGYCGCKVSQPQLNQFQMQPVQNQEPVNNGKKKRKGLVIGIVVATILLLVCITTVVILLILSNDSESDKDRDKDNEKYEDDVDRDDEDRDDEDRDDEDRDGADKYNEVNESDYDDIMREKEAEDLEFLNSINNGIMMSFATENVYMEYSSYMDDGDIVQFTLDDMYSKDFLFKYLASEVKEYINNKTELEADCNKDGEIIIIMAMEPDSIPFCVCVMDEDDEIIESEFLMSDGEYQKMVAGDVELTKNKSIPSIYDID